MHHAYKILQKIILAKILKFFPYQKIFTIAFSTLSRAGS